MKRNPNTGKFIKRTSWKKTVALYVLAISIFQGLMLTNFYLSYPPIKYVRAQEVELISDTEYEEYLLERERKTKEYWEVEENIINEIVAVFPDFPEMVEIARCEGSYKGVIKATIVNPTNGSYDIGPLQISQYYHGAEAKKLGLDLSYVPDNIKYGRLLYDKNGLADWEASRPCWQNKIK